MTDLPIFAAADAAIHHPNGTAARLQALHELLPVLALITTRQAARVVEALARATYAGVPDAEIEGFIAGLHGLAHAREALARQNGTGPQPAFTPSPAPFPQGTGPFAPAPVADDGPDADRGM